MWQRSRTDTCTEARRANKRHMRTDFACGNMLQGDSSGSASTCASHQRAADSHTCSSGAKIEGSRPGRRRMNALTTYVSARGNPSSRAAAHREVWLFGTCLCHCAHRLCSKDLQGSCCRGGGYPNPLAQPLAARYWVQAGCAPHGSISHGCSAACSNELARCARSRAHSCARARCKAALPQRSAQID